MRFDDPGPLMQSMPDGTAAPVKLLSAHAYVYLALMLGIVPTAFLGLLSAALLRRGVLALGMLLILAIGFVGPVAIVVVVNLGGVDNMALVMFLVRLFAVWLGAIVYAAQRPALRGHELLGGEYWPLLWVILGAFALQFVMPQLSLWLNFPALLLLSGLA